MANVTIPPASQSHPSDRTLAREALIAEKAEEQATIRSAALDAPWYNEKLDPENFGKEFIDPQHIAMFNGTQGGRRAASFPERTLDSGLSFHPTPPALTPGGRSGEAPTLQHPEVLTSIIQELWTPSTSYGALGQALAVATDAPPPIAGPAEPPLTISPPLDPEDLPEPPPEDVIAPENSLRAKRRAEWAASGAPSEPTAPPPKKPAEEEAKRQRDEEKRRQERNK